MAEDSYINKSTWIPLGLAIFLAFTISGGVVWINRELLSMNAKLDVALIKLNEVKAQVDSNTRDKITMERFKDWLRLFESENRATGLKVPIPSEK